ncbi:NAD-dependent epimerase/dehydratase family protein [Roseivirga sp.]|uniref:NAD-dependent epimerase/dehydratase family protein n=1 Tax=Roseivirga sp. TaxID=1964215 RepID=UPI003B8EAD20
MIRSVLITGIAGFLGSRMADWILEYIPRIEVIGIDNLSGGYKENIDERITFYQVDCNDDSISDIFRVHSPQIVFHFAAYAAEGLSPFIRKFNYNNNLISTASIVNECIKSKVGRLVFSSSMAVYGNSRSPFNEEDVPNPIDPYGVAKFASEMDIRIAGIQHGLDWCIIRPHNLYGAKQNIWDPYRNVLGIWMRQHIEQKPLSIFGDGLQIRAFSFVDDILPSLWNAATLKEASKEIINLGSNVSNTINHAAGVLLEVMNGGSIVYLEERHEVKEAFVTSQKSMDILNFEDNTNLKEGLTKMWIWAKSQPPRSSIAGNELELSKGLYGYWKI